MTSLAARRRRDRLMVGVMIGALILAIIPLLLILADIVAKGAGHLSLDFVTHPEQPLLSSVPSGFGAGIRGTIKMVALGTVLAAPIGVLAALYLTEYQPRGTLANLVRFFADVMTGIPSIFVGIFVFTVVVLTTGSFSTFAGGLALGILMLPVIVRASEEALKLVPVALRESALALGVRRWRTIVSVVLPTALPGITTGILLAIARAAGETAPLLLTAFGNEQVLVPWTSWTGPESSVTLEIFNNSRSFSPSQQAAAWTGALVLIAGVLVLSLAARAVVSRRARRSR